LKPGLARRVDPGLELGRIEEKIEKAKTWYDPGIRLIRQDPVKN
jgi:hypothetical protein